MYKSDSFQSHQPRHKHRQLSRWWVPPLYELWLTRYSSKITSRESTVHFKSFWHSKATKRATKKKTTRALQPSFTSWETFPARSMLNLRIRFRWLGLLKNKFMEQQRISLSQIWKLEATSPKLLASSSYKISQKLKTQSKRLGVWPNNWSSETASHSSLVRRLSLITFCQPMHLKH